MWKKNGQAFRNPLALDGKRVFNPSKAQLLAAGYQWIASDNIPIKQVRRYSALKIICVLGERWGAIRTLLEQAGCLDQFMAANYIREDDPAFLLFLDKIPQELIRELDKCRWTND